MNRHQIIAFYTRKDKHMHAVRTIMYGCTLLLYSLFPL